jgi:RNA polymerase sigma-70 factor (ECF subfamily)
MVYQNASDIELWQRCRADDMPAYNELFSRYFPKLMRLASRYIKDEMVAEELCMDQLYVLWTKRSSITIHVDFSHYLFRSMRNRVINQLRKNLPVLKATIPAEIQQASQAADYNLLSGEAEQAYQHAISELSPQRRKVFLLSREENLSYAEIASELCLSVNTVENYMVSALGSLREMIKIGLLIFF